MTLRAKLDALIQELRDTHREQDRHTAAILRMASEVLANPQDERRVEMLAVIRDLITTLEKE